MRSERGFSLIAILVILVTAAVVFFGWRVHINSVRNNAGKICAAVITRARNQQTGEVKDFPDPCSVPKGWTDIIQSP